ncbi:hypothetical protein HPB47_012426 [Ixodes persulcatus]|uniref:Uncharacterized protein n=1 Tax=Ixodes persulcatus TaxID=34615 RepID=A0AC60NTM4_IXOPE|nr:hypothetical protein HPB47_012426 [Ixodes persulcatus]
MHVAKELWKLAFSTRSAAEHTAMAASEYSLLAISYDDDLKCITGVVQASMRNKSYAVEKPKVDGGAVHEPADQLFMTLVKLRSNTTHLNHAVRFICRTATVSNVVLTWVNILHKVLCDGLMGQIPSGNKNKACLPSCFASFTNCRIILDCTEVEAAVPKEMKLQNVLYSPYKRSTTLKCLVGVAPNGVVTNSWLFLLGGEPPSATTTVGKRSLVRQGLPCEASPSRTTSSQQQSAQSRRPMIFRSGAVFAVAPAIQGSFVRPPTVAASPARSRGISTEFARVDPGVYDSTVGGLPTLPPCSSPATGGVERCATLRRHGPGPGEVPCPWRPQFLPRSRQPQPLPLQPHLEFPLQFCLQLRLQFLQEVVEPVPEENPSPGTSPDNSWSFSRTETATGGATSSTSCGSPTVLAPPPVSVCSTPSLEPPEPLGQDTSTPDKRVARVQVGDCWDDLKTMC